MNRAICLITLAWASAVNALAPSEIPLYPGATPGSEKWDWQEKSATSPNGLPIVTDVVRPVLLHYLEAYRRVRQRVQRPLGRCESMADRLGRALQYEERRCQRVEGGECVSISP